ncbi:MAG: hypothetical protein K6E29_08765 [Cyanobacteria bacterium RUI128]|nr:hypothetical protein [Cyanobacteria bacterium RUI128]
MLGIQNQPQIQAKPAVSFKGNEYEHSSYGASSPDYFDKYEIEAERDDKIDKINQSKQGFEDLADELENSDNKYAQKAGKGVRLAASLIGLAATFVMAKYSSKFIIESLKSVAKNPAIKGTVDAVSKTAGDVAKGVSGVASKAMENPKVIKTIEGIKASQVGKAVIGFVKNPKVAKVIDPLKKTIESIKNVKINSASIQSAIENTMAATTTGSVLVDNLTGRNRGKSPVELATGV